TVTVVTHREDRRIVAEAEIGQHVNGPGYAAQNAKGGSAESNYFGSRRLFKGVLADAQILAKPVRVVLPDGAMGPAMVGDFMALVGHAADQMRVRLANLSDNEEGGINRALSKKIEQPVGGEFHALGVGGGHFRRAGKVSSRFDAVMLLHVKTQADCRFAI